MARPSRVLATRVEKRAGGFCEYCRFPIVASELPFHCDHIIAEKHGGKTNAANLAWACYSCNLHKGPNIAGVDPVTGKLSRLYHPRSDIWTQHFEWEGAWLRGKSVIGRTTIAVLDINHPDNVVVRQALIDEAGGRRN
jgi:5-methylcytosine-specific restriction endonuclease McrA